MTDRRTQTEEMLIAHYQAYPQLQIRDIFKFLHQSSFGCEHLVTDLAGVIEYIRKEAATYSFHAKESVEPLDGDFCRVHLDWIKEGLHAETLGKLFFLSAKPVENGKDLLEEKLTVFAQMVRKGLLPFTADEVEKEISEWRAAGYPACHHSDTFRSNYFLAYRVIRRDYAALLPLLLKMDRIDV